MKTLKVKVQDGKIVGDAPPGLPEGTVLELCLADPGDDLTQEELAELNEAIEAGWCSMQAGKGRPVSEVIADLKGEREE